MTQKRILLVGDLVGYGRLAITAQASVLTPKGNSVAYLPTALVSNNFCYADYAMLDTTEYMKQTLEVWKRQGFFFDIISIGFIASDKQAEMLCSFCNEQKLQGAHVIVDPIMGDNGHLYSGIGNETVARLQRMVSIADLALPNYTEACLLSGTRFTTDGLASGEVKPLIDKLLTLGTRSVLVTSSKVDGKPAVVGFDADTAEYLHIPYRHVPVDFSGTGDIFSAKLLSMLLNGRSLQSAALITMEKLSALIDTCQDVPNKSEGIPY